MLDFSTKSSIILPALIAFLISVVLGSVLIPFLQRKKFGQYIRDEGPAAHQKKSGTPTMGGLIIILSVMASSLIFIRDYKTMLPILFTTLGFGIVGFLDDFIKIVKKRNLGLTEIQKLIGQIVVTAGLIVYLVHENAVETGILIPFTGGVENGYYLHLPMWLYVFFVFIAVLATVNGTNFTDGLDGLLSGVTAPVAVFFTVAASVSGIDIQPVTAAVFGSLLGFLLFNAYPAKVFMGDTGSLALGGFVASTAFVLRMPLLILIIGIIYVIELLSVVIQVTYFKVTHGKRIFKMAPIHHHFELCGWPETKVVSVFLIITVIACLIGFLAL